MPIKRKLRYVMLILLTAFAGGVSGMSYFDLMVRGVFFGASLGLMVLITDFIARRRLDEGEKPERRELVYGALSGGCIAAFVLVFLVGDQGHSEPKHYMGLLEGWPLLFPALCYSFTLQWAYSLRWRVKAPGSKGTVVRVFGCLAGAALAGALSAGVRLITRLIFLHGGIEHEAYDYHILFSAMIFAVLWMLAVIISGPSWSFRRWQGRKAAEIP